MSFDRIASRGVNSVDAGPARWPAGAERNGESGPDLETGTGSCGIFTGGGTGVLTLRRAWFGTDRVALGATGSGDFVTEGATVCGLGVEATRGTAACALGASGIVFAATVGFFAGAKGVSIGT